MTIDDLRQRHPDLGFALYAYAPLGPVTLEVLDAGETFTFFAPTAQEAIDKAFPPETGEPPAEDVFS